MTTTVLIEDLVKIQEKDESVDFVDKIIKRAISGYYHDFKSDLAYPKVQLTIDLQALGLGDLAEKCQAGDYDD